MRFNFVALKQVLWGTTALLVLSLSAHADASLLMHQGLLTDSTGIAVSNGAYPIEFSIWDAATDGALLWAESHGAVTVHEGAFLVLLGGTSPFTTLFVDYDQLWLQVAADIGPGMAIYGPRVPLSSAPYAKKAVHADHAALAATAGHAVTADTAALANHAATADTATNATSATNADNTDALGGQPGSAYATASHTHNASNITSGTLSTDRFSAYADLVAEGRIGTGATQVAAGDHRHLGLPYFIGTAGPEISGVKTLATWEASGITNSGTVLTAPVAGRYLVHYQQLMRTGLGAIYLRMQHNGGTILQGYFPPSTMQDMVVTRVVNMNAGDNISFRIDPNAAETWAGGHSAVTMWLIG